VDLSEIFYISNIDTVKSLCEKAKLIAETALLKNNSEKVKKSLLKTLAVALNNIGYVYKDKGEIKEALDYHSRSLKIDGEIGNKEGIANSLNSIGEIHHSQGQLKEALDYFKRSLKTKEEIGDKKGVATVLNNIGFIYKDQGQLIEAMDYYRRSLKIQEEIGNKQGLANSLNSIGVIYYKQGQIKETLEYFNRSLKIQEEIGDKKGIANSLNNIGFIYNAQGQVKEALVYALKSLTISQEIGSPFRIRFSSDLLSTLYEKQGKGMKALEMYKLSIIMRDSINNKETQNASAQQQAKYAYETQKTLDDAAHETQKTLDDAAHDKLLAIEQEEKEKQQILTGSIAVGLGLVVIFLIFVFNRLRITRNQKSVIELQKKMVENTHYQLEEKNQEIMDSIVYAKRIQSAILPAAKLVKEYLKESFILYKPKDIVAGDFYWLQHKDGKVLFAAADCTGHGVPGAMVSVVCNNGLNRSIREHSLTIPGEILDKTREIVVQEFEKSEEGVMDGMDIALCSIEGMKLQYAGAHNPLWIIRNGEVLETKANKQPIGQFENPKPYTTHNIDLEKGDAIYIFSDGYVDQFGGEKGKKFKSKAFRALLLSVQNKAMEEQKKSIDEVFEIWKGDLGQIDDVCVIGVRV
jgi:serine phosphatase RsbU (regulator of sigma subunit)/Tfp pilus assembly protein PilF